MSELTVRISSPAEFAELRVAPPTPTGESQPFWDAIAAGRLLVQRCTGCGLAQGHPRRRCTRCWSDALSWEESSGRATIVTHSLVHRPGQQPWAAVAPYYVGLVRLAEGAVMLTHLLTDGTTPRVGDACQLAPTRVGEWVLPFFRLDPVAATPS